MKNVRSRTTKFYDAHAKQLKDRYQDIGPREGDIMLGFALAGSLEHPRILEIGCGYGREAAIILERTPYYNGIDSSANFIDLAREHVPTGNFECVDAVEYEYPGTYDIVFALAMPRHLNQQDMTTVLDKIYNSLHSGGICYMSMNYGPEFQGRMRKDTLGARVEYLYNPELILQLAGPKFSKIYEAHDQIDGVEWFDLALKKA